MAGLGGLLYGVDFGVIAAAEPYLMALGTYSGTKVSLIVGAVLIGGLISSLTAGVLCDWLGRKKTIILSAGMFLAAIPSGRASRRREPRPAPSSTRSSRARPQ